MLFHNLSNFLALLQLNTVLRDGLLGEREREGGGRQAHRMQCFELPSCTISNTRAIISKIYHSQKRSKYIH